MSSSVPPLLAAAAGVGLGHAILPDHWVPLAVVGRTRSYPFRQVARLSLLAGVAHVLVSLLLGALVIAVGLQLRSTIEGAQSTIIGTVLILTGVGFAALELTGHGHGHVHGVGHPHGDVHGDGHPHGDVHGVGHSHGDGHASGHDIAAGSGRARGIAAIMVPFGAAASPDLTILPVFLAATAAGVFAAIGALIVFSVVTIATIVGLTMFACFSGYQVHGQWLERWGNMFTASVLVAIGVLVFTSVI
jgi:nickel/cobalt transporter (NicO) family protein